MLVVPMIAQGRLTLRLLGFSDLSRASKLVGEEASALALKLEFFSLQPSPAQSIG